MERHLERARESEPVEMNRQTEEMWLRRDREKKHAASLPRVMKFDAVPWIQVSQSFYKAFTGVGIKGRLNRLPLYSMTVSAQILAPGSKSGKHRHFNEAILYIVDGDGYSMHDETSYSVEAGDIVCVPTYTVHQHFNSSSDKNVLVFFCTPYPLFELVGLEYQEQLEMHPDYRLPEGATAIRTANGQFIGYRTKEGTEYRISEIDERSQSLFRMRASVDQPVEKKTTYHHYLQELVEENRLHKTTQHVIKQKERPWEKTPMGKLKYLAHYPTIPSGLRLFDCFIQELPPGGRSGRHRHISEEVHFILEGRGYDIQDGVKWEWGEQDIVCIPVNTEHQHFNSDPKRSARFVSFQPRIYHYLGHGGFEHLEDAPDYKP